ncbi:MAG TPA: MFS transporter [Gaiellaceae bacterium]|nr:MFS transporter [Gaiellaceae bacterium]
MRRRVMGELWLAHLAADLASGALPAVLVFLKPVLHLSYTKTGAIVLAATVTSALAQPLFGRVSDRRVTTWLLPAGIAVAAAGISTAAIVHEYAVVLVLAAISGLGVGAFHPEGMKLARHASGERRASGIALFQTGGNLGIALGPLVTGAALTAIGSKGGLVLLVPGVIIAVLMLRDFPSLSETRRTGHEELQRRGGTDRPGPFKLLLAAIGLRSVAYYGLFTFIPLWEVAHGHSKSYGTVLLSCVLFGGAFGTLCMGPLADRYPHRLMLAASLGLTPVFILVFILSGGYLGASAIVLAGATTVSGFGLTTVMGQEYLPSRIATSSGMTVGFAMGLGGVAAVLLGVVADAIDLKTALFVTAVAPAIGVLVALRLPGEDRPRRQLEPVRAHG